MNKTDKENLKLIEYRLDEQDKRVDLLHQEFDSKLGDIHTDIKFIKENLFNPETGLWAETKQNTQFRKNTTMWRNNRWWCYRSPCRKFLGYVHKLNQKNKKKLDFSFIKEK